MNFNVAKRLDLNCSNLYFQKVDLASMRKSWWGDAEAPGTLGTGLQVQDSGGGLGNTCRGEGRRWRAPGREHARLFLPPRKMASSPGGWAFHCEHLQRTYLEQVLKERREIFLMIWSTTGSPSAGAAAVRVSAARVSGLSAAGSGNRPLRFGAPTQEAPCLKRHWGEK